jgi:hypothetical protein
MAAMNGSEGYQASVGIAVLYRESYLANVFGEVTISELSSRNLMCNG